MAQTLTYDFPQRLVNFAGGFRVFTSRARAFAAEWTVEQGEAQECTAAANTANVGEANTGLASLIGKYNNEPSWEEFPAFLEQYRREIDEMNRE